MSPTPPPPPSNGEVGVKLVGKDEKLLRRLRNEVQGYGIFTTNEGPFHWYRLPSTPGVSFDTRTVFPREVRV